MQELGIEELRKEFQENEQKHLEILEEIEQVERQVKETKEAIIMAHEDPILQKQYDGRLVL